jgi:hypothetical protein
VYLIKQTAGGDPFQLPLASAGAAYDEILADAEGNSVLITSRQTLPSHPHLRRLGTTPWSPRTPVVRVSS